MKKVLLLGNVNSSHIRKWAMGIASLGYRTAIFSLSAPDSDWYSEHNIRLLNNDLFLKNDIYFKGDFSKLKYLKFNKYLKTAIESFSPDIIHAHYATSYGILGALSGKHPFILSFWGTDVFDFPKRSFIHRLFIKFIIKKADILLSASDVMKHEIHKYSGKSVEVVPLGIDTDTYYNFKKRDNDTFTIGIIKSLETYYGIENLIKAFAIIVNQYPNKKFRLLIVGDGSKKEDYKNLVRHLKIESLVEFPGKVNQDVVPVFHNKIDLFVCPSLSESFGVSVLEASACEVPVIVSNVGGLPEVVRHNETGIILQMNNTENLVKAISFFLDNPVKLSEFGRNGRRFVEEKFNWKDNLKQIDSIYKRFISPSGKVL
jgi:glycosyltransferase involved in cell wall biosynthesis